MRRILQSGACSIASLGLAAAVEGAYPFVSNEPGDTQTSSDGSVTGLVGKFVLM